MDGDLAARVANALQHLTAAAAPDAPPQQVPSRKRPLVEELVARYTAAADGGGDATSDAATDAAASVAQPWNHAQFLRRLASFGSSPTGWFGKPPPAAPAACAARGWVLTAPDTLGCATCGGVLALTAGAPSGLDAAGLARLGDSFAAQLASAHGARCPWRTEACPARFVSVALPSAGGARGLAAGLRQGAAAIAAAAASAPAAGSPFAIDAAAAHELADAVAPGAPLARRLQREASAATGTHADAAADRPAAALAAAVRSLTTPASAAALLPAAVDGGGGGGGSAAVEALASLLVAPAAAPAVAALCGWAVAAAAPSGGSSVQPSLQQPRLSCSYCSKCVPLWGVPPAAGSGAATTGPSSKGAGAGSSAAHDGAHSPPQPPAASPISLTSSTLLDRAASALAAATRAAGAVRRVSLGSSGVSGAGGDNTAAAVDVASPPPSSKRPRTAANASASSGGFHPLRAHAWYCPLVRSSGSAGLPAPLAAHLLLRPGSAPAEAPSTAAAAPADVGPKSGAPSPTRALGGAVAAGLTTLSRAATGTGDGGSCAGGAEAATAESSTSPQLPAVAGWLVLALAAAAVVAPPADGTV